VPHHPIELWAIGEAGGGAPGNTHHTGNFKTTSRLDEALKRM
jgi:hypothetical protein